MSILFPGWGKKYAKKFLKFLSCLLDPLGVCGIDDVDQRVGIGEVVAPVFPEGLLSSDIPDVQFEFIVGEVLDVEALGGSDGRYVLDDLSCTSFDSAFRIVVLPALSRPRTRIRSSSFLFLRRLRRIPMRPPACVDINDF